MPEDRKQQIDRELKELLEELRIVVPGVQLLGGFLLAVAFQSRFGELSARDTAVYFVAFLAASFATLLFLAPAAQHRILWRRPKKELFLRTASMLTFIGSIFLTVSLVAVVYLIANVVYGDGLATATAAGFAVVAIAVWYALPALEAVAKPREQAASDEPAAAPASREGRRAGRGTV